MSQAFSPPNEVIAKLYRPMCVSDLQWVSANERELHAYPWSEGNFSDSLSAGYSSWIMTLAGEAAGYAILTNVLDEAHLLNISIARSYQRRGCGAALLEHLCSVARDAGANQMFLEVRPSNLPAISLYKRHAFATIGRRKGYYPAVEGREDALVMRRAL